MLVGWMQVLTGKIFGCQIKPLEVLLIKPSVVTVSDCALAVQAIIAIGRVKIKFALLAQQCFVRSMNA